MSNEYPMSVIYRITWNFLDCPISRRKLENGHSFICQIRQRCLDLGGRFEKRIVASELNYVGEWWFPEKDMVEIKELLEDCGYEVLPIH